LSYVRKSRKLKKRDAVEVYHCKIEMSVFISLKIKESNHVDSASSCGNKEFQQVAENWAHLMKPW
jgi:hypothetical protein